MRNLVRLSDYSKAEISEIFKIAKQLEQGQFKDILNGKTIALFFPESSIRTRVTFEKGIYLLGGQSILFPSKSLDKKEEIKDVIGYLNNWADCIIVRHSNINLLDEIVQNSSVPVINAMTSINHPCEILSDLYALSKLKDDYMSLNYLFVGARGNIGLAWKEASELLGFSLTQSCPEGYEMDNVRIEYDISKAISNKDIVLTDSKAENELQDFKDYQITLDIMSKANEQALLNPCPPFFRGEEVSSDVINSKYFVGYGFKKSLIYVQQAIIIYNMFKISL